jgi:hypothetical protein
VIRTAIRLLVAATLFIAICVMAVAVLITGGVVGAGAVVLTGLQWLLDSDDK